MKQIYGLLFMITMVFSAQAAADTSAHQSEDSKIEHAIKAAQEAIALASSTPKNIACAMLLNAIDLKIKHWPNPALAPTWDFVKDVQKYLNDCAAESAQRDRDYYTKNLAGAAKEYAL